MTFITNVILSAAGAKNPIFPKDKILRPPIKSGLRMTFITNVILSAAGAKNPISPKTRSFVPTLSGFRMTLPTKPLYYYTTPPLHHYTTILCQKIILEKIYFHKLSFIILI